MIRNDTTEQEKQEDLEVQYAKLAADRKAIIFCPWCSQINRAPDENEPPVAACCPMFAAGVELIGRKKFQSVLNQLKEVRLGARRSIKCPYCGAYNTHKEEPSEWPRPYINPFCCDLFSDAALAIAQKIELDRRIETAKRVEDAVAKGSRN